MKWPLGINPGMDRHAAGQGLSHWSATQADSNEYWMRRDGVQTVSDLYLRVELKVGAARRRLDRPRFKFMARHWPMLVAANVAGNRLARQGQSG